MSELLRVTRSETYASDALANAGINSLSQKSQTPKGPFRNVLINGDFQIYQRGAGDTSTYTGYRADRWRTIASGYSLSQRILTGNSGTDPEFSPYGEGFRNVYEVSPTVGNANPSATHYIELAYRMEGRDAQVFRKGYPNGSSFCLSFWVYTNKPGTYSSYLYDATNGRSCYRMWTVFSSRRWTKIKIKFPPDPEYYIVDDTNQNLRLYLGLAYGTGYTGSANPSGWRQHSSAYLGGTGTTNFGDSTSNIMRFTGFQLEPDEFTPFEFMSREWQLQRCQRYYWRWDTTTTSSEDDQLATNFTNFGYAYYTGSSTTWMMPVNLPVLMRELPDFYYSSANHFRLTNQFSGTNLGVNSISLSNAYTDNQTPNLIIDANASTAGDIKMFGDSGSSLAWLAFDAEF